MSQEYNRWTRQMCVDFHIPGTCNSSFPSSKRWFRSRCALCSATRCTTVPRLWEARVMRGRRFHASLSLILQKAALPFLYWRCLASLCLLAGSLSDPSRHLLLLCSRLKLTSAPRRFLAVNGFHSLLQHLDSYVICYTAAAAMPCGPMNGSHATPPPLGYLVNPACVPLASPDALFHILRFQSSHLPIYD